MGSPDRFRAICDEYAARDSRMKVIHQPNGGVSVAWQMGIDNVTGGYSIHVDPDDWVEPTIVEELVAKAIETGAEYVICDYFEEYSSGDNTQTQHPRQSDINAGRA
ncbi:MAG: glycosyltransferase [Bacteroidaceae bacterium]|nr:glycosyltransferase [Bacteroidaceae bacterium]